MIEVEVKLPLYKRSLTEKLLLENGFQAGHLVRESDWYYNAPDRNFNETDEALRIRCSENLTTLDLSTILTYKGPKIDTKSMTRKEIETSIEDVSSCREILSNLGYTELAPISKLRQYYHKEDMTACVDQVTDLGAFLELEIILEKEDQRENALQRISQVLEAIDSSMKETTRISYLSMILRKQGIYIK